MYASMPWITSNKQAHVSMTATRGVAARTTVPTVQNVHQVCDLLQEGASLQLLLAQTDKQTVPTVHNAHQVCDLL
jgi:hypothetical protein